MRGSWVRNVVYNLHMVLIDPIDPKLAEDEEEQFDLSVSARGVTDNKQIAKMYGGDGGGDDESSESGVFCFNSYIHIRC